MGSSGRRRAQPELAGPRQRRVLRAGNQARAVHRPHRTGPARAFGRTQAFRCHRCTTGCCSWRHPVDPRTGFWRRCRSRSAAPGITAPPIRTPPAAEPSRTVSRRDPIPRIPRPEPLLLRGPQRLQLCGIVRQSPQLRRQPGRVARRYQPAGDPVHHRIRQAADRHRPLLPAEPSRTARAKACTAPRPPDAATQAGRPGTPDLPAAPGRPLRARIPGKRRGSRSAREHQLGLRRLSATRRSAGRIPCAAPISPTGTGGATGPCGAEPVQVDPARHHRDPLPRHPRRASSNTSSEQVAIARPTCLPTMRSHRFRSGGLGPASPWCSRFTAPSGRKVRTGGTPASCAARTVATPDIQKCACATSGGAPSTGRAAGCRILHVRHKLVLRQSQRRAGRNVHDAAARRCSTAAGASGSPSPVQTDAFCPPAASAPGSASGPACSGAIEIFARLLRHENAVRRDRRQLFRPVSASRILSTNGARIRFSGGGSARPSSPPARVRPAGPAPRPNTPRAAAAAGRFPRP